METIVSVPRHIKLYTAALAMAALVITLLAVNFTTDPAQAQNADNTFADPVPCGPGPNTGTASMEEPHEVTTGHYAIFDSYWEWTQQATDGPPARTNEGAIRINDCPPEVTETIETVTDEDGNETTKITYTRSASNIDIGEALMHVENTRQVDVVATSDEITEGQLSLEEYPDVRQALGLGDNDPVPDGTKVWWLQLDDPDTTEDETSDLRIGFSAALFDTKYWLTSKPDDGEAPMRWMLEGVVYRNVDEANPPHFFAYEAPMEGNAPQIDAVWDSFRPDVEEHDMTLDPEEYRSLQWIFTGEGSYTIQSQFQGFVRSEDDRLDDSGEDWRPISSEFDETSSVREYVFQVGDNLHETEPPRLGVSRRVHEKSSAGTHVGEPIRVFNSDVPGAGLKYTLDGEGKEKFDVNGRTHPNAAQIVVASGANLDYETKGSYDLVLNVSDGKDHEGNNDDTVDHFIVVEIDVVQQPHVYTIASNHTPTTEESITLRVNIWALPEGVDSSSISYTLWESSSADGFMGVVYPVRDTDSPGATANIREDAAGTYKYTPEATYTLNNVEHKLRGDPVIITWRNP